jgi:hypothetical protein
MHGERFFVVIRVRGCVHCCAAATRVLSPHQPRPTRACKRSPQPPLSTRRVLLPPSHTGLTGDFESEVLRLCYSSMTTPASVYDQHLPTGVHAWGMRMVCFVAVCGRERACGRARTPRTPPH